MAEGRLMVCGTPIGNLDDLSPRQATVLREADIIYAEDTRRAAKLTAHVGSTAPVRSLFAGNETGRSHELVDALEQGSTVVLISDAGMPSVSDPGALAVRLAAEAGYDVTVIPGPSAVTAAVAVAGFGGEGFIFFGFLPRKGAARSETLARVGREPLACCFVLQPQTTRERPDGSRSQLWR